MKLIICPDCSDVLRLYVDAEYRYCKCKHSWGRYKNNRLAIIGGKAIPIGIDNLSLHRALKAREKIEFLQESTSFNAFVIPYISKNIEVEYVKSN